MENDVIEYCFVGVLIVTHNEYECGAVGAGCSNCSDLEMMFGGESWLIFVVSKCCMLFVLLEHESHDHEKVLGKLWQFHDDALKISTLFSECKFSCKVVQSKLVFFLVHLFLLYR